MQKNKITVEPQKRIIISSPKIITPSQRPCKIIHPAKIKIILPSTKTSLDKELEEMGWKKEQQGYRGRVKGNRISYEAFLYYLGGNFYSIFIQKPSERVLNGRYRLCIHKTADGWWHVNFQKGRDNPLGQIYKVQEYLREVGE